MQRGGDAMLFERTVERHRIERRDAVVVIGQEQNSRRRRLGHSILQRITRIQLLRTLSSEQIVE